MSDIETRSRPLNSSEKVWLSLNNSNSPLGLLAELSNAVDVNEDLIKSALELTRLKHPYLGVCVNKSTQSLETTTEPIPFSTADLSVDSINSVRDATRQELLIGINIESTLVRVHLISTLTKRYLLLLGDHMAFDGRSFVVWLDDIMQYITTGAESEHVSLPFVDWSTRTPDVTLEPFVPRPTVSLPLLTAPTAQADAPYVEDVVTVIDKCVFQSLKQKSKSFGVTLNGPLMVAFCKAIIDTIKSHKPELVLPLSVSGMCAVDVRGQLVPPLPRDYISSVAGLVSCNVTLSPEADLWAIAAESGASLASSIAAGEGFRMKDIMRRGAYAEIPALFAGPFIWSNIGHFGTSGIESVETHLLGAGNNPIVSGHCVEANDSLALTVTYSPAFHSLENIQSIANRFSEIVAELSAL